MTDAGQELALQPVRFLRRVPLRSQILQHLSFRDIDHRRLNDGRSALLVIDQGSIVQHPNRSAIPFYEAKLLAGGFFVQFKIEEQGGEFVGV